MTNVTYERFQFNRRMVQEDAETRILEEFAAVHDSLLRDKLIIGSEVKRYASNY